MFSFCFQFMNWFRRGVFSFFFFYFFLFFFFHRMKMWVKTGLFLGILGGVGGNFLMFRADVEHIAGGRAAGRKGRERE